MSRSAGRSRVKEAGGKEGEMEVMLSKRLVLLKGGRLVNKKW